MTSRTRRDRRQSLRRLVDIWLDLFRRHELLTFASNIAFRALVALVALVLLTVALLGQLGRQDVWTNQIGPQLEPKVLPEVYAAIDATFQKIFATSSVGIIAFALLLTVWEVSSGVRACMAALSRIYESPDDRPFSRRLAISIALAAALTVALVGTLLLATAARTAVHGGWSLPFTLVRWLLAVALMIAGFGLLVRFAPAERRTKRWATGGAALVVVAWIVQTLLFWLYLRHLANFRTATGSLLGVYFLTTYLYVGSIVLLVGMELDEQLRKDVEDEEEPGILQLALGLVRR